MKYVFLIIIGLLLKTSASALIVYVPTDYSTIQNSVDSSSINDTIIIMPGVYYESVNINSKKLVISSLFLLTNDTSYISSTIVDGSGGAYVFKINENKPDNSIIGLTIRNASDGIAPYSKLNISYNYIYNCVDGIDYENNSGGVCDNNIIFNNNDDAIDLDDAVEIDIIHNVLRDNNDDGIEIRMHAYNGDFIEVNIIENEIYANGEDGIQIIGDITTTNRILNISKNLIYDNSMVGIGSMANMNTIENYLGSSIIEDIYITNNTISNNNYGITGSNNMLVLNNIIINNTVIGLSKISGNSIVTFCNFWNNGVDTSNIIIEDSTCIYGNPTLDQYYFPYSNSIIIDKGTNSYAHDSLSYTYQGDYNGTSVDIGAKEYLDTTISISNAIIEQEIIIDCYPNPSNKDIIVSLNKNVDFYYEIYSLTGKLEYTSESKNSISECRIDLSSIHNGVYILTIVLESGKRYNKKIIKI